MYGIMHAKKSFKVKSNLLFHHNFIGEPLLISSTLFTFESQALFEVCITSSLAHRFPKSMWIPDITDC